MKLVLKLSITITFFQPLANAAAIEIVHCAKDISKDKTDGKISLKHRYIIYA